jgi:hypothetical protein
MNMKTRFLFAAIFFTSAIYSQDTMKLKKIDALVNLIETSEFKTKRDTIKNDQPQIGLSMRTYLTIVSEGTELKKYENNVHATTQENGTTKQMVTTNAFYFDHNKLIKVEEFATQGDKKMDAFWYYSDDKPIYYTLKSEKAQERAELLLTMAKTLLEKMGYK